MTGVQTCALPISKWLDDDAPQPLRAWLEPVEIRPVPGQDQGIERAGDGAKAAFGPQHRSGPRPRWAPELPLSSNGGEDLPDEDLWGDPYPKTAEPERIAAALAVIPNSKRLYVLRGEKIEGSQDDPLDWHGWAPPSAWQHGTEQAARKKGFLHSSRGRGSGRNTSPVPKRRKHSLIATPQKGGRHSPNVRPIRSAPQLSSGWPTRPRRAGGRSTTRW